MSPTLEQRTRARLLASTGICTAQEYLQAVQNNDDKKVQELERKLEEEGLRRTQQ